MIVVRAGAASTTFFPRHETAGEIACEAARRLGYPGASWTLERTDELLEPEAPAPKRGDWYIAPVEAEASSDSVV